MKHCIIKSVLLFTKERKDFLKPKKKKMKRQVIWILVLAPRYTAQFSLGELKRIVMIPGLLYTTRTQLLVIIIIM